MADLVISGVGTASPAANHGYTTLALVRAAVGNIADTDTSLDDAIIAAINAASRQIDSYCGWRFWQDDTATTRELYAYDGRCVDLLDDEGGDGISTTSGLIVAIDQDGSGTFEQTLTVDTDFILKPRNAARRYPVWPYTEVWLADNYAWALPCNGRAGVQITAQWGWPAVPDEVAQAALIQASQLFKAKDAVFGVAGVGDMGVLRVRSDIHPIARGLLAPFRKPAVG